MILRALRFLLLLVVLAMLVACAQRVPATAIPTPTLEGPAPDAPSLPQPLAFVRQRTLYLGDPTAPATWIDADSCGDPARDAACQLDPIQWSPDGEYLLYLRSDYSTDSATINVLSRSGERTTLVKGIPPMIDPAWSPDGTQIAYLLPGPKRSPELQPARVMTVDLAGTKTERGETMISVGCGGVGAITQRLFDEENVGQLGTRLAWAQGDLLLHSTHCTGEGISRFDLQAGEPLEPYYPANLRAPTLNAARDRWAAAGETVLVTGTPGSLDYDVIETAGTPLALFFGRDGQTIFYSTRSRDGATQGDVSTLWRHDGAGETKLWEAEAFGIVGVTEGADGSLLFVSVDNDTQGAFSRLMSGTPLETVAALFPPKHLMRLTAPNAATIVADDVAQLTTP